MKRLLSPMAAVPLLVGGLSLGASADDGFNILNDFKFHGEIRPRYEYVDIEDNNKDAANAFTARTTLGVAADLLQVEGLSAYLEGTSVNNFGYRDYDALGTGINSNPIYDVIKDPQQARFTQAYVDYKRNKTLFRAGRQLVNLDNQRFIGSVGWRQMFQTFDAVAVVDNSIENLSLLGAYIYGINGIGEQQEATDTGSVVLHASYKVMDELSITAYDYMLASVHDTYGLALTGKVDAGAAKLEYRTEYARQDDAMLQRRSESGGTPTIGVDGKPEADAHYYNLDLGANISGILVGIDYELLSGSNGSDGKTAFSTPLATLHGFNGWADVFLATPQGGLIDKNVRLGYADKNFGKILAVYHQFTADKKMAGKDDLGMETDISYGNKIPNVKGLSALISGAWYKGGDATGFTNDKTVAWLMLDYKFTTK